MSQIRITVGALRDRSVDDVFDGLVSKAKRARAQVASMARNGRSRS
jgi:ribosomal protein S10